MRPMDRLSAAVHVPDNRAASIIPPPPPPILTSLSLPASLLVALAPVIKTKLHRGPCNELSCEREDSPTSWPRRNSGRVTDISPRVTDYPCRIFADANLNTAYAQTSSTFVRTKPRVIGDVCCNVHFLGVAQWIITATDDKASTSRM